MSDMHAPDSSDHPAAEPSLLADAAARAGIRSERERNLLVIAGAGTGKTTSIIDRVLAFIAPHSPAQPAVPIDRIAVITFTRRAAGELRFRVRQQILQDLARERDRGPDGSRRAHQLYAALTALDAAAIGTIHGFADRLLRLRPIEAKLSPAYVLAEDNEAILKEAFRRLRLAAETGVLGEELGQVLAAGGGPHGLSPALVAEAEETMRAATRGRLQIEHREGYHGQELPSLEGVLGRMIDKRDVEFPLPSVPDPELATMRAAVAEVEGLRNRLLGHERGTRHMRDVIAQLRLLEDVADPEEAFAVLKEAIGNTNLQMGRDFGGGGVGWSLYKVLCGDKPRRGTVVAEDLRERLHGPSRWLAARIVRLAPVAEALYAAVKAERELVDFVDILVKLRNLLRDDRDVRAFYQARFDHIFVDEFQDTDPLQCEVLFYLCEAGATASKWSEVKLAPGRLTLVGDPKQSIYRFRRADVATYAQAEAMLERQGARVLTLATNFRSRPELVRYFNERLAEVLDHPDPGDEDRGGQRRGAAQRRRGPGAAPAPPPPAPSGAGALDPETGQAYYEPLAPAPPIPSGPPPIHVLPFTGEDGVPLAADSGGREVEAATVASYVRWLLASDLMVRDPAHGEELRRVHAGDIAVLAPTTTHLHFLLDQFDARGIEYSIRGGTLFLSHPLVRRFLLALRALADPDDGVAAAALYSPPIFAIDAVDLTLDRAAYRLGDDALTALPAAELAERRSRVAAARAFVADLRARRHARSPGATGRDLIERTGLGRAVLAGANGRQVLGALYQVAFEIERRALAEHLDFDAATRAPRDWADAPVFLDLPEPLGDDAVRVTTVHQAKGLEFPVVILWDGFHLLREWTTDPWLVGRDGASWALNLKPVTVAEPKDSNLTDREKEFKKHERARLYYVAATRARDILVLPLPAVKKHDNYATARLAAQFEAEMEQALVRRFDVYRPDVIPDWAGAGAVPAPAAPPLVRPDPELDRALAAGAASFAAALAQAAAPRAVPRAVTAAAHAAARSAVAAETEPAALERAAKAERSRHGQHFGIVVHRALELVLGDADLPVEDAVRVAIEEMGIGLRAGARAELAALAPAARADVERALAALERAGLRALDLATEVDVTAVPDQATLLRGAIDLVAVGPEVAHVIDWKTDAPVRGPVEQAYPAYAEQLRLYSEALRAAGWLGARSLRAGLLLTATGEIRWLD